MNLNDPNQTPKNEIFELGTFRKALGYISTLYHHFVLGQIFSAFPIPSHLVLWQVPVASLWTLPEHISLQHSYSKKYPLPVCHLSCGTASQSIAGRVKGISFRHCCRAAQTAGEGVSWHVRLRPALDQGCSHARYALQPRVMNSWEPANHRSCSDCAPGVFLIL